MKLRPVAVLFTFAASIAHAGQVADSQWRANSTTLATLLQDGYRIVSVISVPRGNAGSAETFYLQRDQSAFKCVEQHLPEAKTKASGASSFGCFELVQPYMTPNPN